MNKTVKKIAAALLVFAAGWECLADSGDVDSFLARARAYENEGKYVHALGCYWDAMEADPENAGKVLSPYMKLCSVIGMGKPGSDKDYDAESFYEGWFELCKEFELYWTENCPHNFLFGFRADTTGTKKKKMNCYVDVSVGVSQKFKCIRDVVQSGLYSRCKGKQWNEIPAGWPSTSVFKEKGTGFLRDGVAVSEYNTYIRPAWYFAWYDMEFDVVDRQGKVLLTGSRDHIGSDYSWKFADVSKGTYDLFMSTKNSVSQETLDLIKSVTGAPLEEPDEEDQDTLRVVPTGLWLKYGKLDDGRGRVWRKSLPEKRLDVSRTEFIQPDERAVQLNEQAVQLNEQAVQLNEQAVQLNEQAVQLPAFMTLCGKAGDFYIMSTEVTQRMYAVITGKNPSHFKGDLLPVEGVTWYEAVGFCNKLSELMDLTPCYSVFGNTNPDEWGEAGYDYADTDVACDFSADGWRLPTEAEWDLAARGGDKNSRYKYSGSDDIDEVAWYFDNSIVEPYVPKSKNEKETRKKESDKKKKSVIGEPTTHLVATKKPNALGLYDMTGNVWEWCQDKCESSTAYRIIRGGSWGRTASESELSSSRDEHNPSKASRILGFRAVRKAE